MSEEMTVENNVTDVDEIELNSIEYYEKDVDEIEMDNVMAGEPVAEPEFDPAALGVGDLSTMATVLEAAAQRGTIRANEMQVVGQLYTKLHAFLVGAGLREVPATGADPEAGAELPNAPDEGNTND